MQVEKKALEFLKRSTLIFLGHSILLAFINYAEYNTLQSKIGKNLKGQYR